MIDSELYLWAMSYRAATGFTQTDLLTPNERSPHSDPSDSHQTQKPIQSAPLAPSHPNNESHKNPQYKNLSHKQPISPHLRYSLLQRQHLQSSHHCLGSTNKAGYFPHILYWYPSVNAGRRSRPGSVFSPRILTSRLGFWRVL